MYPPEFIEGMHHYNKLETVNSRDISIPPDIWDEKNESKFDSINNEVSLECDSNNQYAKSEDDPKSLPGNSSGIPDPNIDGSVQQALSDDEVSMSDDSVEVDDSVTSLDLSESASESSDSDTETESVLMTRVNGELFEEIDEEDEAQSGPILSKNEVKDEVAPTLPSDYQIPENSALEYVGDVSAVVERNVIIKANISGEFRVLKENSVLCFEDKSILGLLYETFGRLQSPNYRVKFNNDHDFQMAKNKKGARVFYVVSDSQFLYTDTIKKLKGTDASNCHDEELPEHEQEFSDDEQELVAKQEKKRKRQQKKADGNNNALLPKRKQHGRSDQSFVSYGFAHEEQNQVQFGQFGHFNRDDEAFHPPRNVLRRNLSPYSYATDHTQAILNVAYQGFQSPQYEQHGHYPAPTHRSFGVAPNAFNSHSTNTNSWAPACYAERNQPLPSMPNWNQLASNSYYQQGQNQWNSQMQGTTLLFQRQNINPQVLIEILSQLQHLIASQTSSRSQDDTSHKENV